MMLIALRDDDFYYYVALRFTLIFYDADAALMSALR